MKYPIPTIFSPIDPALNEWKGQIPEKFRQNKELMDFLLRICHRIYEGNNIARDSNVNPFYKIVELLNKNRLEYDTLEKIDEYYHFDIIGYLIDGNRGEFYLGYPCNNKKQLQIALGNKRNLTNEDTLVNILSNIV